MDIDLTNTAFWAGAIRSLEPVLEQFKASTCDIGMEKADA